MKKLVFLIMTLFICIPAIAQRINTTDQIMLQQKEDSMKIYASKIIDGINPDDRLKADSIFTRLLMRAIKTTNSFFYRFDSLENISLLYAPDSSFRIFTWQLMINENVIRQHGAIQMQTRDGSLKRYPLIDRSDITKNIKDTVGNNNGWIGAVYYKIIQMKYLNRDYYTLLGFDEHNINSSRKIIEVLRFENDEPIFGGQYFSFEDDAISNKTINSRFIMDYKKNAGPKLNYDTDLNMIIAEHLISESNEPQKKWTLVGDGDYEGFKWMNGKWIHVEKIYNYITPLGKEPIPNPLKDNGGNPFDNKLNDEDNEKKEPVQKTKSKPVNKKGNGDN